MRKLAILGICSALIVAAPSALNAKNAVISPMKIQTIISPSDEQEVRTLLYFELPEEIRDAQASIDFATLSVKVQISDADIGQIAVFPLTTDWKSATTISWSSPWTEVGGDFAEGYNLGFYSLKSEEGMREISIDVTSIARAWIEGSLENNGMIVVSNVEQTEVGKLPTAELQTDGIILRIFYSKR